MFLEVVPLEGHRDDDLPARLLPIVQVILDAERNAVELTGELAARYEEIDLLYTIGELLGRARSVDDVAALILREVTAVVGARRAALRIFDAETRMLSTVASLGVTDETVPPAVSVDEQDIIVCRAFRSGRIETGVQPTWVPGEVLAVPITYATSGEASRVIGTLALAERSGGGAFTREETKLVAAVATQIGAALENARLVASEHGRQRLERELELAHDLQLKLMPTPAVLRGEADVAVESRAAESLGGDFYTFSRLGVGRIGVMLGDVSSHGFSAALIAAQVMAAAGIYANATTPPDETLGLLRDSLADELATTEMYLTTFYGVLDPTAGRLTYTNAGHPYAYRLPRFGPAERLAPTAPPLGLVDESRFGRRVVPWHFAADTLVLFTDGLIDQPNAEGERYGEARIIAQLEEGRGRTPEQLVRAVMDDVMEWGGAPTDDCTLLVLRM
ncbi:MAG: SpoIIE family protein phosphatase [Gemmatimonadales bacterium]|jgi:sigma-B regulation protein RsbU (phosphoserine phosphatase)|nr:SpoIIE family protein phosphatase [Gemmatimonadales bacterium]MBP6569819.1 SpoIIE family protein phosphatase [Gemmatimonadales bacterium]MBP7619650.1 SpoIIE family protein phosphatase [Gemmatimonadales bacterium]MBP9896766.1 SpoIIE family protein phosphatase [Gemmatimonadales bacterium]